MSIGKDEVGDPFVPVVKLDIFILRPSRPHQASLTLHFNSQSVFARISSTIVKPRPDRPYEGMISIHFELSPMASTSYETGR